MPEPRAWPERSRRRPALVAALAKDLLANRGNGLIVAGERQPAAVHAAAARLNARSATWAPPSATARPRTRCCRALSSLDRARCGDAGGHGPDAGRPGRQPGLRRARRPRLRRGPGEGPAVVPLGHRWTRPRSRRHWHLPRAHFLEAWGDAGGRRPAERGAAADPAAVRRQERGRGARAARRRTRTPGYDLVRETWQRSWARRLRHLEQRAARRPAGRQRGARGRSHRHREALGGARARSVPQPPPVSRSGLELVFLPSARSTTDASPTTAGSRSCPMPSPR